MECEENGKCYIRPALQAVWRKGVKRKFRADDVGVVRLDVTAAVPRASATFPTPLGLVQHHPNHQPSYDSELPFMNTMDEITYWIHTRRAPCLLNYDNPIKKQNEKDSCSKLKPKSIHSASEAEPSPKKKKKRKLSILDDDGSVSLDKQQNIYFEAGPQKLRTVLSSCKSDTLVSDIDFNIKKSSIQAKPKRFKLQKNNRKTVHKKNKVITSTPKVSTSLRRSLRKAQNSLNNNSNFNVSFEVYNADVIYGNNTKCDQQKIMDKKPIEKLMNGDDRNINNKKNRVVINNHKNVAVHNGQFEDLSDVSGFTANYIRSTKIHSTKTPRNLRSKGSRNLMKESQQNLKQNDESMFVCVNKSMNTKEPAAPAVMNCSTDSSQNIMNLITVQNTDKNNRVNRGTSILKFLDAKTPKNKEKTDTNMEGSSSRQANKTNLFKSRDGTTLRYPTRNKNCSREDITVDDSRNKTKQGSCDKRRRTNNNSLINNSERKENPKESSISRTRSGRSIGLKLQQSENSVLVLNNTTEQDSSVLTINVAAPSAADQHCDSQKKKKRTCVRNSGAKKDKSGQSLCRDSLRDRSGFAACFSDSDDSEPLKQGRYFC